MKRSLSDNILALPSSLYWAWAVLSIFCPLLSETSHLSVRDYALYFTACLIAGGVTALVSHKRSEIAFRFLSSLKRELALVALASLGSAAMLAGSHFEAIALTVGSGIVVGFTNACFALAWGRMYAQRGSETSSIVLCLSLAVGVVAAGLVTMLPFAVAAVFTVIMPELIVLLLLMARSIIGALKNEGEDEPWEKGGTIGGADVLVRPDDEAYGANSAERIFWKTPRRILGVSPSLAAACTLVGLCVGYLNGQIAFLDGVESSAFSSGHLIALGGLMFMLWAVMFFAPRAASFSLAGAVTLGLAGYAYLPATQAAGFPVVALSFMFLGLVGMFIAIWLSMTELSYQVGNDIVVGLGAGLALAAFGTAVGFGAYGLTAYLQVTDIATSFVSGTVGVLYTCAILLLFMRDSELWGLVKEHAFLTPRSNGAEHEEHDAFRTDFAERVEALADERGLTEREKEVLRYLIMGRSRPRIAEILVLSENTVSSHVQHIYRKFDVHSNQELLDTVLNHKSER